MAISMLKIRRPLGRLIFNMGIATPGKTVFLIETAPRFAWQLMTFVYAVFDRGSLTSIECTVQIGNHIHTQRWGLIIHPYPIVSCGLAIVQHFFRLFCS